MSLVHAILAVSCELHRALMIAICSSSAV